MAEKKKMGKWTRRAFIGTGGLAGLGLIVGIGGNFYLTKNAKKYSGEGFGDGHSLNAWIRITPDNRIIVAVPRAEMGQGVYTALPMLIAEELEVEMTSIDVIAPQPEPAYANTYMLTNKHRDINGSLTIMEKIIHFLPLIATGGSTTIRDVYDHLRGMGATAREMLIQAAAQKWNVGPSECYAENGHIINRSTKERLTFGALAEAASSIKIPKVPAFKDKKDFKIIGKPIQRLDIPEKVNGTAQFGLDVRLENMLYAVLRHATYHGGAITTVKNQAEIEAMAGVKKVIILDKGKGAVAVADNTWNAKNAALMMEFEETGDNTISSEKIAQQAEDVIANKIIATPVEIGDAASILDTAENVLEGKYDVPYLAHACMEPMNCTVLVNGDKAEAWVGHQGSSIVMDGLNASTGIAKKNITVNSLYLGGGFGRRAEVDMVKYAGHVAKEMAGTPIQLVYTREEDIRHEMYRPAVKSHFRAKLGADGAIEAWENKFALQSVSYSTMLRIMPSLADSPAKDPSSIEGAANIPYATKSTLVAFGQVELPIEVGNWRSVGSSQNGFFVESFVDECAHAAKKDPYLYRKSLLTSHPRFINVLDKIAVMSNWNIPLEENKFRGIAIHESFGSIVAEVAEITKVADKEISVDKFYCVIDCGKIVNPDTIEAQMQSGIIYGLTAAMYNEITFKNGEVEQYNFPQYEMLRMNDTPEIIVHIMDSDEEPGGVGEPGTPPAAPALANAIFAATGDRVRSLPFKKHGYKFL